jgi:hypothetical protein
MLRFVARSAVVASGIGGEIGDLSSMPPLASEPILRNALAAARAG